MSIKKIACCTDFSENADAAFDMALDMADKYGAKLSVIHVVPPFVNPLITDTDWGFPDEPQQSLILKIEDRMEQEYGTKIGDHIDYEFVVMDGHVSTEILKYLEDNTQDILVMGSYGLTGMGLVVFGSVAKRVAHKAPCSVMIVRKPTIGEEEKTE